jgi:hypothetical protein
MHPRILINLNPQRKIHLVEAHVRLGGLAACSRCEGEERALGYGCESVRADVAL